MKGCNPMGRLRHNRKNGQGKARPGGPCCGQECDQKKGGTKTRTPEQRRNERNGVKTRLQKKSGEKGGKKKLTQSDTSVHHSERGGKKVP